MNILLLLWPIHFISTTGPVGPEIKANLDNVESRQNVEGDKNNVIEGNGNIVITVDSKVKVNQCLNKLMEEYDKSTLNNLDQNIDANKPSVFEGAEPKDVGDRVRIHIRDCPSI